MSIIVSDLAMHNSIKIADGSIDLRIDPKLGGSFTQFSVNLDGEWVEVMRHTPENIKSSSDTASFLMAPYPNRIRDGKFSFQGRDYQLKFSEKHSIHGDVRNREWKVVNSDSSTCQLSFNSKEFEDVNFPFPFSMLQSFHVENGVLRVDCKIKNEGESDMPVGCGYHPYYKRALKDPTENVMLKFNVKGTYPFSGDTPLPDGMMIPISRELDFSSLRELDVNLDHCFGGWSGPAIMYWPESKLEITMMASYKMSHLVLYSPKGQPFFAFEPQTQMNDGFNFYSRGEKDTGVNQLAPGEELNIWFSLSVKF